MNGLGLGMSKRPLKECAPLTSRLQERRLGSVLCRFFLSRVVRRCPVTFGCTATG